MAEPIVLTLARASVRSFSASARLNVLRTLASATTVLSEAIGVAILLSRFDSVGGWSLHEVLVLLGIADAGLGLGMLVAEPLEPPTFSQLIREGRFDAALTRPLAPWLWVVSTDVQIRNLGRVGAGFVILGIGAAGAGVTPTPAAVLVSVGAILAMGLTVVAILTIGAAVTMWTIEGTELLNAFTYGGATLAGWPLHIFSTGLRAVFVWVVPVGVTVYVPALWLLDRPGDAGIGRSLLPLVPVLVAGFGVAAGVAWRAGIHRYRGVGA